MPSAIELKPRVPAWQRLGLKLKNAPEPATITEAPELSKRKELADLAEAPEVSEAKRSKKSKSRLSTEPVSTPNLTRKKSVQFTPETKVEDGESIKQLFNKWTTEQKLKDPSFQLRNSAPVFQSPDAVQIEENVDPSLDEKLRKVKRVKEPVESDKKIPKKSKAAKAPKVTQSSKSTRPFLAYIQQYKVDRANWKFNKNHQNQFLRHVFDLELVPSSHAHLIYSYVRGLQGGVRTRLRDIASSIKIKDQEQGASGFPETMQDQERRQQEYEQACNEYVAAMTAADVTSKTGYEEGVLANLSDSAMASRVAKRTRAEQILAELGSQGEGENNGVKGGRINTDDENQKRARMNDGSSQKIARKRKQRTAAYDSDSDSDSSSSDSSDSESDSDESEPTRGTTAADDSSSSSSSSSSSDSDSNSSDSDSGSGDSDDSDSD